MTYYAILPVEKINLPDWSQLDQDRDSARRSNDDSLLIVSFLKAYKEEFEQVTGLDTLSPIEITSVLQSSNWTVDYDI